MNPLNSVLSRLLVLSAASLFVCPSLVAKEPNPDKQLKNTAQQELELRVGMRDVSNPAQKTKSQQRPLFVIQQPGMYGRVSGTASVGEEIVSAFQGVVNVVSGNTLVKTPAKKDFLFQPGEVVRVTGVRISGKFDWAALTISTVQSYSFASASGGTVTAAPSSYVVFQIPQEWLREQNYEAILDAMFQWIAPQDPSALPARATAVQPQVEQAEAPSARETLIKFSDFHNGSG